MEIDFSQHSKEKNTGILSILKEFFSRDIKLFGKKINDKIKEQVYLELYTMFNAGVDVKSALEIVVENQKKKEIQEKLKAIFDEVIIGKTLSKALKDSSLFTPYEYHTIAIGEESGNLPYVLKELYNYYSRKIKQRRQLMSALSYPVLILFVAMAAVFFMLRFVVPMFSQVFDRFGKDLPVLTKYILRLSEFTTSKMPVIAAVFVVLIFIFMLVKQTSWYKLYSGQFILKIPVIKDVLRSVYSVRVYQTLAMLLAAHHPLLNSIQLVKEMISFYPLKKSLELIEQEILKGNMLYIAMKKTNFFDKKAISLVKVAEEVNQLENIFKILTEQLNDEIEYRSQTLNNLLEPIMIVLVGVMVAVILIAMYLPIFKLSTSIF